MQQLAPWVKHDAWGSTSLIPEFIGVPADGRRWSELWYGSHPDGPTRTEDGELLAELIVRDSVQVLGQEIADTFGPQLPFLVKVIAAARPLSVQVHPAKDDAQRGFLEEERRGIGRKSPRRTYRDMNHKPEMLYALTEFKALIGFRPVRGALALLEGLPGALALNLRNEIDKRADTLENIVAWLLSSDSEFSAQAITEFAESCRARLRSGSSPDPKTDRLVSNLARIYPDDAGIVVAFLMTPLEMKPGDCVYVPPRTVHTYQSGLGLEVMAASDNVVRAGLTDKHIDRRALFEVAEFVAREPHRLAPTDPTGGVVRYVSPAEEFDLSVVTVRETSENLPSLGPRVVLCTRGTVSLSSDHLVGSIRVSRTIRRGEAVFVSAESGSLNVRGEGQCAQFSFPS